MYLGSSAESSSARRSFLIAALILWSNSTTVSFGQNFFLISSRVTNSPPRSISICRIWKGWSCKSMVRSPSRSSPTRRLTSTAPRRTRAGSASFIEGSLRERFHGVYYRLLLVPSAVFYSGWKFTVRLHSSWGIGLNDLSEVTAKWQLNHLACIARPRRLPHTRRVLARCGNAGWGDSNAGSYRRPFDNFH